MANQTYLKHAPIIEAVIELRVRLSKDFNKDQLQAAASNISNEYPIREEKGSFEATMQIEPQGPTFSTKLPRFIGLFLKTPDQKQIVQFRIDGFAFSRLKPYTKWQEVSEEARRLWQVYAANCSPDVVDRIAVRYINRMEIPHGEFELHDYLAAPPAIPKDLSFPPVVQGFFHRIVITDRDKGINTTIIQKSEVSPEPNRSILVLDIDAYKTGQFNIDDNLFGILGELRDTKNDIFFKSITEKTVELFK